MGPRDLKGFRWALAGSRLAVVAVIVAALALCLDACGRVSGRGTRHVAVAADSPGGAPRGDRAERIRFGDYDVDDSNRAIMDSDGDDTSKPLDGDGDADNPTGSYYDRDDSSTTNFGHSAGFADRRAVTTLVYRFYAFAKARDGDGACRLLAPVFVQIAAEFRYHHVTGRRPGIREACRETMAEMFAKNAAEYARGIGLPVASVLVKGDEAVLLLASRDLPAVRVVRERGVWKLGSFFDRTLP